MARQPIRFAPRPFALAALAVVLLAGCHEEETTRYSDAKIIETLHLEEIDDGYAVDGDPFCEVDGKLLNDADEVSRRPTATKSGWCSTSREGNVGILGVAPFAPDCQQQARKRLNKLDPKPKED